MKVLIQAEKEVNPIQLLEDKQKKTRIYNEQTDHSNPTWCRGEKKDAMQEYWHYEVTKETLH